MLTIGEFSRIGHISARMLRHYDQIGLLRPMKIGEENGYRYYEEAQLAVLAKIEKLKGYGFQLAEISALLELPDAELSRKLHARRLGAYRQLTEMRRTIRRMEEDVLNMEEFGMAAECYQVIVMQSPAQRVFGIRRTINVSETHELFQELYREMEKRGLKRAGVTQQLYHGQDFSYDAMDVEAQAEVEGDSPEVQTIPARQYASVIHTGPYESVKYAYDALAAWMAEHPEYRVCGPAVERYLKDEGMVHSDEELETGVMFPVEKAEA